MSRLQTNALRHLSAGSDNITLDSAGRVLMPNQPAFKAHANYSSFTNGDNIPFPTVSYNRGGCYNSSNFRFTAPVSGFYVFGGELRIDGNYTYVHWQIRVNGSIANEYGELPGLTSTYNSSGFAAGSMSYARYLNANDYIQFIGNISGSGTISAHTQSYVYGYLIG